MSKVIMICDACLTENNKKLYKVITNGKQELFCVSCYEHELGVKI